MISFSDYIEESVILTNHMVQPTFVEGYVKLFFAMLSQVNNSFKKETDPRKYSKGCGTIFSKEVKSKIFTQRPTYTLLDSIIVKQNRIFYTLELDWDSKNVILKYRDYKAKDLRDKYLSVILAKKQIIADLKAAGFSVKSDRFCIYASTKDYMKNPSEMSINGETRRLGMVLLNTKQNELLSVVKKLFEYKGVFPGFNRWAICLMDVTVKEPISDMMSTSIEVGAKFDKVVVCTNGKIQAYTKLEDKEPTVEILQGFPSIGE